MIILLTLKIKIRSRNELVGLGLRQLKIIMRRTVMVTIIQKSAAACTRATVITLRR